MKQNNLSYKMYLVTDLFEGTEEELLAKVEKALEGGVTLVQLREKEADGKEFYERALRLKQLLDRFHVPLIINDRVDIALAVGAFGVHVGQDDLPLKVVRSLVGDMIVGVSVRTVQEAKKAVEDGADYIGVGAVFPTSTKLDAKGITKEELTEITGSVRIPAVAIGGITAGNIEKLNGTGIRGAAVVSAILKSQDPKKAAEELNEKLNIQ
ncbi:thiamine phosphate synthase [Priestia filamentosa]|uniref:Thiamine-phosphate synthase n=1 Tax=Priestia filamentosa TaxID=1402861 RepID=A0A0H4KUA0_9BACI|nr:thiamine phosphate synthase [Priestia filamentosa]AKO91873.1 thiamine-phosphate diphosphorylase [Priestia filamentosa]MDT3762023.1 thiamine phosphate synthase [Priestia filamentosa]RJS64691.1 thiamine phosphate synthase [Priestia filamentosa]WCM17111.1 thiamine phosphate synthase [Priestia filamentosa]WRU96523.1 thiamine phosphate synthase [Priestia filamentosa]